MASSFQRQSQIRKVAYAVLILALFTATLFWRQLVVEAQADTLTLREQNIGDQDLTGAAMQLTLTGSRGVAVCGLWWLAIDKQRKQEWNELELLVAAITRLQPHFPTPWLFQSWNLSYNVSVQCDRPKDKYFYICRGIELLAEGERQNRNNPDLRFEMGFYYQNKLGMADENNTLRTLFQLSCIDPVERDPNGMRKPDGSVDLVKFEAFCQKHPHVARRLRESLRCQAPEDVLDFLAENYELPSRYEYPVTRSGLLTPTPSRLKPPDKQFPAMPLAWASEHPQLPAEFDNYAAGTVWFEYAQMPLPPPNPSGAPTIDDYDHNQFRLPRRMATIIFRGYPARGQSYVAERMQKEGWYDRGWEVDEGWSQANRWFPDKKVVIGAGRNWAAESWTAARNLWEAHGLRTGLYLDPFAKADKLRQAKAYREAYGITEAELGPDLRDDEAVTPEVRGGFQAHRQLFWYERNRALTNFGHFHAQAQAESRPDAIAARRLFFKAHRMRSQTEPAAAIVKVYGEAFPQWKKVLDDVHDFRRDIDVQEETYKVQYDYLAQIQAEEDARLTHLKHLLVLQDFLAQGIRPASGSLWLPSAHVIPPRKLASPVLGPFDAIANDGLPYLSGDAIKRARQRMGFSDGTVQAAPPRPRK